MVLLPLILKNNSASRHIQKYLFLGWKNTPFVQINELCPTQIKETISFVEISIPAYIPHNLVKLESQHRRSDTLTTAASSNILCRPVVTLIALLYNI